MKSIAIVTDSSAYLPQTYVDQYQVSVLPLTVNWDDASYRDGVDISATEFYTRLKSSKTMPTTSQVTMGAYLELFRSLLDAGKDVIYMGISKGISASYFSAEQAKAELGNPENLIIVDTQLVSMALSLMVIEVCKAAANGASLKDCERIAYECYPKIWVYFTVESLEYLHRGGRINSAKRLLGSALNLKPIMEIRDGKIELVESVISRRKSLTRMVDLMEKRIEGRQPVVIAPFHALCEDDLVELERIASERVHPVASIRSEVSPVIGSHVGPGTVSVAFMAG